MPTLDQLLAQLSPALRAAFLQAMEELRAGVDVKALTDALRRNDIEAAIAALNIEPAAFSAYYTASLNLYATAAVLQSPPGTRFDMTNPHAEAWIRELAATRITGYTEEQVTAARETILRGYQQGNGPQQIAVEIAGRVDRVTGRRKGGIIGLSAPQSEYVGSVRELLGGDLRALFVKDRVTGEYKPRYTRMDGRDLRTIRARIRSGKPLTKAEQEKIAGRYADRLLARRADDVARTETATSVMGARAESYRQALDKAGLPPEALRKRWRHLGAKGEDARVQHIVMNNKTVQGLDSPFVLPDGTLMQYAHDPAGGAAQVVNCKCDTVFEIDFGWGVE